MDTRHMYLNIKWHCSAACWMSGEVFTCGSPFPPDWLHWQRGCGRPLLVSDWGLLGNQAPLTSRRCHSFAEEFSIMNKTKQSEDTRWATSTWWSNSNRKRMSVILLCIRLVELMYLFESILSHKGKADVLLSLKAQPNSLQVLTSSFC